MKILDIGCGLNKQKTSNRKDVVIGLDAVKVPGIDVVWNLEKTPLPFKKKEFNWVKYEFSIDKPLFRLIKRRIETSKWWFPIGIFANKFPDIYEKTGLKFLFPASTIYFELEVLK